MPSEPEVLDDPALIRAKAERAKRMVESEDFQEFLQDAKDGIVDDWKVANSIEAREFCHARLQALVDLESACLSAMNAGEVLQYQETRQAPQPRTLA